MGLLDHVMEFHRKTDDAVWDGGLLVGVSGGPDSLALLHLLSQYVDRPPRIHVAHLDHSLRPNSSDDARFVSNISKSWGFPISDERKEVATIASTNKISLEEAGRQTRYDFLTEVAQKESLELIMVGHNADDQVETILMHLLRGAGLSGLRGMHALTPMTAIHITDKTLKNTTLQLGRPLLTVTRAEIEAYCKEHGLHPRYDVSNADTVFFRNELRHEILPVLERVQPNIRVALRRMATVLGEDTRVVEQATRTALKHVVSSQDENLMMLHRSKFAKLLPGLKYGVIRHAIMELRPNLRDFGFRTVSQAADFCTKAEVGQQRSLPGGITLTVDYQHFIVSLTDTETRKPNGIPFLDISDNIPIVFPGYTHLGECGWSMRIDASKDIKMKSIQANHNRWTAYVDADQRPGPLLVRPRRQGERFQPLGMKGNSQSLAYFMSNARIPHAWRNRLPLLVAGERVLWIPGWRLDQRARVRRDSRRILRIQMLPPTQDETKKSLVNEKLGNEAGSLAII